MANGKHPTAGEESWGRAAAADLAKKDVYAHWRDCLEHRDDVAGIRMGTLGRALTFKWRGWVQLPNGTVVTSRYVRETLKARP
jgi:hypothetical protein